jgi:hypothetical protein
MPRKALPEFGAHFHARVVRTANGLHASFHLIDEDGVLADTNARLFASDRDARNWLNEEAGQRGFQCIAIELGNDRC